MSLKAVNQITQQTKTMNILESSKEYITGQITKINQNKNNPAFVLNAKWRIASNLDLFEELDPTGQLTDQQIAQVDAVIAQF